MAIERISRDPNARCRAGASFAKPRPPRSLKRLLGSPCGFDGSLSGHRGGCRLGVERVQQRRQFVMDRPGVDGVIVHNPESRLRRILNVALVPAQGVDAA